MNQGLYGIGNTSTGAISKVEIYEFTRSTKPSTASGSNGSYTWSVPANAKLIEIFMIGGGGGGSSGRRGASGTNRFGGGGGGSAGSVLLTIDRSLILTPLIMSIGAGGAGGAAVTTNDTNGNNGGNGVTTTLTFNNSTNILFSAFFGLGATGGTNAAGAGGTFVSNSVSTFRGSTGQSASLSNLTTAVPNDRAISGPAGIPGAAGGSISSSGDVILTPGFVLNNAVYFTFNSGQTGANSTGGAASTSANASSGSNGASYGYGGCGGGASANGFSSGAGGNGVDGYIRITVWY
jgi:hypothetical protein